jgi:purine-binding chemotaxis protein CheW
MSEPVVASRTAHSNVICFFLGQQQFGADLLQVKETIVLRPITRVFLTPAWVAGVINLRGDVVAVVDLAVFLGMAPTSIASDTRILLARSGARSAGLLVDRLAEVRTLDLAALDAAPPTLATEVAALSRGVVTLPDGAPLVILDLGKFFESERFAELRRRA